MNDLKSFTIFNEIFRLIDTIQPIEKRDEFLGILLDFYFKEKEPILKPKSYEETIWLNVSKPIKTYKSKVLNGKKGGRPKKTEIESKNKSKNESKSVSETKTTTNVVVYNNKNIQLEGVIGGDEAKIVDLFQSKGIMYSNTPEEQNIVKYLTTVDKELIKECIEDALIKNKGNINYIFGIIKNKVRDAEKRKKALPKKETPKWFDKEQKKDEQGLDELKEILEDLGEENDGNKN